MPHGKLLQLFCNLDGFDVDKSFIVDTVDQTEKTSIKTLDFKGAKHLQAKERYIIESCMDVNNWKCRRKETSRGTLKKNDIFVDGIIPVCYDGNVSDRSLHLLCYQIVRIAVESY